MSPPSAFRWRAGRLEPLDAEALPSGSPAVADSWLLEDGTALGLDAHRDRFLQGVAARAGTDGAAFWDAALAALPRTGAWFPRLELAGTTADAPDLALRVRPAPERVRGITLATHRGADPRSAPTIKGPDLDALAAIRATARTGGVDDVVLLASDGSVAETTTSNLAWWHGDALCVPDTAIPQLPGVTVGALVVLATALGIDVRHERVAPDDLDGFEIWALNSLHGIRIVTGWPGGPAPAAEPGRLATWRRRLDALRRPLPEVMPA
ncbi:aminotransferase class IV [Pseudolysinimonas kribbensis]|uniref:aminotransferase class IV n=1 Tax=Pseudolysinimonas kribbensis TaxID=433641 RepID=UPI0031D9AA1B